MDVVPLFKLNRKEYRMWMIHFAGQFWDAIAEEWTREPDNATRMPLGTARMIAGMLGADTIPEVPRTPMREFPDATKLTNVAAVWEMWQIWYLSYYRGRSARWS
jgi:hypothetical protein